MKWFDLKTFVTICMTIALLVFTGTGKIGPELFVSTAGAVFAYYFNKDKKTDPTIVEVPVEVEKVEEKAPIGFNTSAVEENESRRWSRYTQI